MKYTQYLECKKTTEKIFKLFDEHQLPHYNAFAFAETLCAQNRQLRSEMDYLLIAAILWSPNEHLFFHSITGEQIDTARPNNPTKLQCFKMFEPEQFEHYCNALQMMQMFQCNTSAAALDFAIRFKVVRELLLKQREYNNQYQKWFQLYNTDKKHIRKDSSKILADEALDDISDEQVFQLMKIVQEYLKNLMQDPKNRRKYSNAYGRISQYIAYTVKIQEDDFEDDDIVADDIIFAIFARMLKLAKHSDLLKPIAPMYLCWLIEYRLLKITDPKTDDIGKINLLLTDSKNEELFPLKIEWHSARPSISDESRVYLFDEICELWRAYRIGSNDAIGLSKFIFEKTLPYYRDFIKTDRTIQTSNSITHQYVKYKDDVFSSDLLQRCISVFDQMLTLHVSQFHMQLEISDQMLKDAYDAVDTHILDNVLEELYHRCFQKVDEVIKRLSNSKRKITTNSKEYLNTINHLLRTESLMTEFKKRMILNPLIYGARNGQSQISWTKWQKSFQNWICDIRTTMEFEWKIKCNNREESSHELKSFLQHRLHEAEAWFLVNALVLFGCAYTRHNVMKSLVLLSKEIFFGNYTDEQYQRLCDFYV